MLKIFKSGIKLGLIVFLIQSTLICIDGLRDKKTKAAIGIVLGNKINPNGSPSERLQERLNKSIQLYRAHRIQMILVSGGFGSTYPFNQKEVCFIVKANYIYGTLNQSNEREIY